MPSTLTTQPAPAIRRIRRWRFLVFGWMAMILTVIWLRLSFPWQVVAWVVYIGGSFGTGPLLDWLEARLCARAEAAQWRSCPACLYPLEPGDGACPECGRPYSPESLEREWTNR